MKAVLKILLGVAATVLVGVSSIAFDFLPGSAITAEIELQRRADQMLAADDFSWMQVTIDGQKAIISGDAPSHQEFDRALTAVRTSVWRGGVVIGGVTTVDDGGIFDPERLPLADPFTWIAEREDGAVVFSGYAPSDNARDAIFKLTRQVFPGAEISGAIDLADGAPPEEEWLIAASTSIHALARLDAGAVKANGAQFVLTGAAESEERADVLRQLMSVLPAGIIGVANIEVVPPASAEDLTLAGRDPASAPVVNSRTSGSGSGPDSQAAVFTQASADACRSRLHQKIGDRLIGFSVERMDVVAASRTHLVELAAIMGDCPQFSFEITGHTDTTGSEAGNLRLSQRRAEAVLTVLEENGVAAQRLSARGAGSTEPLEANTTLAGRRRNRRIEIKLIYDPQ